MTNGGSDARLDDVDLENNLHGISDHSAVPGELRDSYPNHFGPNRFSKKQQIESNLQSQAVKSNLLGLESNRNVPKIAI